MGECEIALIVFPLHVSVTWRRVLVHKQVLDMTKKTIFVHSSQQHFIILSKTFYPLSATMTFSFVCGPSCVFLAWTHHLIFLFLILDTAKAVKQCLQWLSIVGEGPIFLDFGFLFLLHFVINKLAIQVHMKLPS